MTTVLHLDAVTRVHGSGPTEVTALKSVTFRAHAGELVAAAGPVGARSASVPATTSRRAVSSRSTGSRSARPGHEGRITVGRAASARLPW